MKNTKVCKSAVLLSFLTSIVFLSGCMSLKDRIALQKDDLYHDAVEAAGGDFYFQRRTVTEDGVLVYDFETNGMSADAMANLVNAFNDSPAMSNDRISLAVWMPISRGAWTRLCYLDNYHKVGSNTEKYDGMYYLYITDKTHFYEDACNPEFYSKIEGIRELHVDEGIQEKADDMGIDWYSYWPDLEVVVVEGR